MQIDVERFSANNAHVHLVASIDSDHPDELRLSVYQDNDSPAIEELALTATMGNYERLRRLWLHRCVVDSRELMGSYTGDAFTDPPDYPLNDMLRTGDGDAIVFATTNEEKPSSFPGTPSGHWHYPLPKLTQYWRIPAHDIQPDLRVRINGRRVYWASHDMVPGGIAYENFDVRQRYVPGQSFRLRRHGEKPVAVRAGCARRGKTRCKSRRGYPERKGMFAISVIRPTPWEDNRFLRCVDLSVAIAL